MACNELAGPTSESVCPWTAQLFLKKWRAVCETVSDLTGPRFEPLTSRSRDNYVIARPTGRYNEFITEHVFADDLESVGKIFVVKN